jgi:RNA polymerase sigma-70 factor (ECF subfamily)
MDLTVETFAKAFENIEKYKPDFAFSTWIFKIATNNCIDFVRKKRLKVVSLQSLTEENRDERQFYMISNTLNPEETSIKKEESENLKNILEHLPQRYRTLIILKYYDEKSYEEISQQLDLPLGTVKAQLSRARELMSNIMNLKKNLRSDF